MSTTSNHFYYFAVDRVITSCDDEVLLDCVVTVNRSNGKIASVTDKATFSANNSGVVVTQFPPNSTLLPGFIDCHVHLTIKTDDYQIDHLRNSSADKSLLSLRAAQGLLRSGFTTLRSAGDADTYYPTFALAKAINRGEFVGPSIVGAGHYISVTGGGGDMNFLAPDCLCCCADGIIADGRDQMVEAVRKEIKYGSDWIKVLATGAFMSASTGPKDSPENTHFSNEEVEACVQEARRRQVHVMAHAHGAHGIAMAANAGCRSIEHASFIDEEGIEACLRNGTWIVPTFLVGEHFVTKGSATGAQDRTIQLLKESNERHYKCIQNAVNAGVNVALGSDFVGWDPKINASEFRFLVELAKMTPLHAIRAGTSSAADMLGNSTVGRVKEGLMADLVVVQGNPIDDISLLETGVVMVVKGGKIVRDSLMLLPSA